jgi:hypothetical protein
MYSGKHRSGPLQKHGGPSQAEYIAEVLARPTGNATGHVGNQLENILRIKARISLRHFVWEAHGAHKYRNTERRL